MKKYEFLAQLQDALEGLPPADLRRTLDYYAEMIDDRMEEGLSEEDAVAVVGTVEEIVSQVVTDTPLARLAEERANPKKRLKAWEILLLALGSPLWLSLAAAVLAVILSLYVSLWCVCISLWAVFGSLVGGALGGVVAGIGFWGGGHLLSGAAMLGAGIVCAGLSVFLFYGCKAATKGLLLLSKQPVPWIKHRSVKKEETQ